MINIALTTEFAIPGGGAWWRVATLRPGAALV